MTFKSFDPKSLPAPFKLDERQHDLYDALRDRDVARTSGFDRDAYTEAERRLANEYNAVLVELLDNAPATNEVEVIRESTYTLTEPVVIPNTDGTLVALTSVEVRYVNDVQTSVTGRGYHVTRKGEPAKGRWPESVRIPASVAATLGWD